MLYTPNAPDGITFREVASQQALNTLLDKNEWKLYTAGRKSPVNKDDVAKAKETLNKHKFDCAVEAPLPTTGSRSMKRLTRSAAIRNNSRFKL